MGLSWYFDCWMFCYGLVAVIVNTIWFEWRRMWDPLVGLFLLPLMDCCEKGIGIDMTVGLGIAFGFVEMKLIL